MVKEIVRDDTPKRVQSLQFGILSPQEIMALSEFESVDNTLYLPNTTERQPTSRGVLDRRLGTSEKAANCETCGLKLADCVGHYAYIKLVLPVFHFGYFKQTITMLQDICKSCSRVLLTEQDRRKFLKAFRRPHLENLKRQKLAKEVNTLARKVVHCPYCGEINGTVKKAGGMKIVHEKWRAKKVANDRAEFEATFAKAIEEMKEIKAFISRAQDDLNPLKVTKLFKAVSAEDCELLGLDPEVGRPEEFIWSYIPVPPVCIRPSVAQESATNEDDLTVKLAEIISANNLLKISLLNGQASGTLMEQWEFLQATCAMYINADVPLVLLQNNPGMKPIRGLCQRLKGKQGRFRGNLSGKRVDFSGRTVISPDPNLRIDEVAVPISVAKTMTYPEKVTEHNYARLHTAVLRGTDEWPGANYAISKDGFKRFLKFQASREMTAKQLKIGDVVERHLIDNDIVLFNRQPSLHKLSIMSHRVKVRPWKTFRFNEFVCNPYNADFDGDEMNLHVPQTEEARTEATELMNIKYNIVTPRNGQPIIAANQDFITASFLISRKDSFFDRQQFCQVLSYTGDALSHFDIPPPAIYKPQRLWTGKQIFNLIMKPNKQSNVLVNLEAKCKTPGKVPKGYLPDMMDNDAYLVVQNSEIMCGALDKSTIGDGKKNSIYAVLLRDYGPDAASSAMNQTAKLCARWFTNRGFSIGIGDVTPGFKLAHTKDDLIQKAYENVEALIESARRGKLQKRPGCDAEQTLEAEISGILSKVRTELGEYCMVELSPNNSPLIMATSGSKGSWINVSQMVACVGQQIISGSRVPDGFQDRSLPHFMKKAKNPPNKGFVSNSFYTGLSPSEFLFHACSGREGLVDTAVKTAETGYMQRRLMKALEDLSVRYDSSVRNSVGGIVQFASGDDGLDPALLEGDITPIDFVRSWRHIRAVVHHSSGKGLYPSQIRKHSEHILRQPRFKDNCLEDFIVSLLAFVQRNIIDPAIAFRQAYGLLPADPSIREIDRLDAKVYSFDASQLAVVNNKTKVTEKQLKAFFDLCWHKYIKAKVEPGTAVGAIGAQSIGEPGTQMTLKTFHFAGVASMNITLGVPRIKEIINASKIISTPIITARLEHNFEQSARIVKGRIEKTYLKDIASVIAPAIGKSNLYISIHLDMITTNDKLHLDLSVEDIARAIQAAPKLKIESVRQVRGRPRLHVYAEGVDPAAARKAPAKYKGVTEHTNLMDLYRLLPSVVIKGISQCSRAVISKKRDEVELLVEGQGLKQVMVTPGVIGKETVSNHIMEVEKVLGIEAARRTIVNEISHTMSEHGLTVDPRHLGLLADTMTVKGEVLGITRFGIAKMKDSVLMLASFEKTTDHLFEGAFYAKRDAIHGVSECIIMGNPANFIGTSLPSLVSEQITAPKLRPLLFETAVGSRK